MKRPTPLWKLHLYVPDYQGSIIGVVDTSTGYPEQVTNYCPYGTPHTGKYVIL